MLGKSNFSLTQLEYVLALHKHGHFAKAAESCHVTQPTLSMQIQKLEDDLGVVIFDRSKKPILLTDVGQRIIEQIQTVLYEARKIEGLVRASESAEQTGELTLGVIPTIAPYVLPLLLPVLESQHQGLKLKILELQTHRIVEALSSDEIDVGLLATPLKIQKIFEYPLFYEPFSVYCQKNHALGDLKKVKYSNLKFDDIWLLSEGHCLRHQVLDVCSIKDTKSPRRPFQFESGSLETIKSLVENYGGYTLLPELATRDISKKAAIIPFDRPIPAREVGLVYRREHYKLGLIETLGEAILDAIPEHVRKIRPKDLEILPIE
jgi:LysR family hydrogen peroxide-inducible transcriptional activator